MMKKKKKSVERPGAALIKGAKRDALAIRRELRQRERQFESMELQTKSITELPSLETFLEEAELAGRAFDTDREAEVLFFDAGQGASRLVQTYHATPQEALATEAGRKALSDMMNELEAKMPRRPAWVVGTTTPEELDRAEKESFLEWRRGLAKQEELASSVGATPTPYEKNIQFWRQLWRVVERCDVLVQVVDARDPHLYRFPDLEAYVKEVSPQKRNMLIVNKSDFLTREQRLAHVAYFAKIGVDALFFSAKIAQAKIEAEALGPVEEEEEEVADDTLLNRDQLLERLTATARDAARTNPGRENVENGVIGMCGYPNVGKSSVINALVGASVRDHLASRVSVSATPGHTKHFQTLLIGKGGILCDCPGLIFPSFRSSKSEMLCSGILPIDEIKGRDFEPALEVLTQRVDRRVIESYYKIKIDAAESVAHCSVPSLIDAICIARGFHATGHGRIDESKGARLLLKDLVAGRLLYSKPPPDYVGSAWLYKATEELDGEHVEEDAVLYESEKQMEQTEKALGVQSRRLARHGRKHKKGRDKNPYDHPIGMEGASFAPIRKTKGNGDERGFTRKVDPFKVSTE